MRKRYRLPFSFVLMKARTRDRTDSLSLKGISDNIVEAFPRAKKESLAGSARARSRGRSAVRGNLFYLYYWDLECPLWGRTALKRHNFRFGSVCPSLRSACGVSCHPPLVHTGCQRERGRRPRVLLGSDSVEPAVRWHRVPVTDRRRSQDVKQPHILAAMFAGVLAATGVIPSQAQLAAGATMGWGWPGYGPYVPFRYGPYWYGWTGPWGPCSAGACVDNPYLRRAIQRELAQLEHLRELEQRAQRGLQAYGTPLYGTRGDWPPPTPEAQMQPAYRGSGEIRPEFSGTGQRRQDFAGPLR